MSLSPMRDGQQFDLDAVSRIAGIPPGVLRAWEMRHGWPRPSRDEGGGRTFTAAQVDEIVRLVELVRSGHAIERMIKSGVPQWPSGQAPADRGLSRVDEVPQPDDEAARNLRRRLVHALRNRDDGRIWALLMRGTWEIGSDAQVLAVWLPCLIGLEEFRRAGRPLERHRGLHDYLCRHIRKQLGHFPTPPQPIWVVPTDPLDVGFAYLLALMMSRQGAPARPWHWDRLPNGRYLTTGAIAPSATAGQYLGHVDAFVDGTLPSVLRLASRANDVVLLTSGVYDAGG
jgi:DNA-binding transcriptional MerR regulator